MTILIVEDNPVNAKILEVHLQKNDYETVVAATAKEALEYLMSLPQVELIITDILMPEMDGLQMLAKIKEQDEWKDIPVIMCSSLADLETVRKAVKAGCEHYLIKPIERRDLLGKVKETLRKNKAVLHDKKEVITRLGLDEETYENVVGSFSLFVSDKISHLEKHIAGGTESEAALGLAELHENATYFGAERLKVLVEKLSERRTRVETDKGDSDYLLLLKELRLVLSALEGNKSRESKAPAKP
jgi:CheY-like chemotaxis protein